jgi:hypothetical protein
MLALSALGAVACQMQRPIARGMPRGSSTVCVFGVRGVRAVTRETDDGMDVIFTVVGDGSDGDELRKNAHAAMTGEFHVRPEARAIMQKVTSTLYDRPDGLTIHATPIDPAMLEEIRNEIRHVIDESTSDRCD